MAKFRTAGGGVVTSRLATDVPYTFDGKDGVITECSGCGARLLYPDQRSADREANEHAAVCRAVGNG